MILEEVETIKGGKVIHAIIQTQQHDKGKKVTECVPSRLAHLVICDISHDEQFRIERMADPEWVLPETLVINSETKNQLE